MFILLHVTRKGILKVIALNEMDFCLNKKIQIRFRR